MLKACFRAADELTAHKKAHVPKVAPGPSLGIKVYRVRFILAGEDAAHNTYIQATNIDEATRKLAGRFPGESKEIHIESIDESHGKFVIGSEDQTF